MNAQELRQGNWILEVRQPHQIEWEYDDWWAAGNFEPIELTPEILEACGFEYRDSDSHAYLTESYTEHYIYHDKTENTFDYCIIDFGHDGSADVEVKYLHRLQNLYFALTGQELEVKLPLSV